MTIRRIICTLCAILLTAGIAVTAQKQGESRVLTFRFAAASDRFYDGYLDNHNQIAAMIECVNTHKDAILAGDVPVAVFGYCDSCGSTEANLTTARTRSNRVKSEMITRCGLTEQCFRTTNHSDGGNYVEVRITLPTSEAVPLPMPEPSRPVVTAEPEPESTPVTLPADTADRRPVVTAQVAHRPHIDLRANLLRWATLTPDLGIEWHIAERFSILAHGSWTSWSWNDKDRRYALWEVLPEGRLYLGKNNRGYIGAYGHYGDFNYKFTDTGRQGTVKGGGIKGGYVFRLNKALSLDLSIGIGGLNVDYDKYYLYDGTRVRLEHYNKNYWGVTHAGVTLVWNIF